MVHLLLLLGVWALLLLCLMLGIACCCAGMPSCTLMLLHS
jgi:hypothetical protein